MDRMDDDETTGKFICIRPFNTALLLILLPQMLEQS